MTAALALVALGAPAAAQAPADQVTRAHEGRTSVVTGVVIENALASVAVERDGRTERIDAREVVAIHWGDVPPAFQEGRALAARSEWQGAGSRYRVAARDASARALVKAAARAAAAECFLHAGADDPSHYEAAIGECHAFLEAHAENREAPRVRSILARATWLAGDPREAAALYRAIHEHALAAPPSAGWDAAACVSAGVEAAWAYLEAGDTASAREMFAGTDAAARAQAAHVAAGSASARAIDEARAIARIGEGFCLLVGERAEDAARWLESYVDDPSLPLAARYAATLGLAEASLAAGRTREAQISFARVSAADHTSRDRVARALVGLARCALVLGEGRDAARRWLDEVRTSFSDTTAAREAARMLGEL